MKTISILIFVLALTAITSATEFYQYDRNGGLLHSNMLNPNSCYFDPKEKTLFVIHGFMVNSFIDYMDHLRQSLLQNVRANVIMVDWSNSSMGGVFAIPRITKNVRKVATDVGNFITSNYIDPTFVHCIGSGFGAHVCGFVGKFFNGKISRISGLDPTGVTFDFAFDSERLSFKDAQFVDVIHTSSDYGIKIPIGTADYYPNGGLRQPGCQSPSETRRFCDTERAVYYFAESTNFYSLFRSILCVESDITFGICKKYSQNPSDQTNMGYYAENKPGIFFLNTNSRSPFALFTSQNYLLK